MTITTSDLAYYMGLAKHRNLSVSNLLRLRLLAQRLRRLYETGCNRGLTEREQKRVDKLETEAEDILARGGYKCRHCRDPRGAPIVMTGADLGDDERFVG